MTIKNESDYLVSMSKPLQEKLKISAFISPSAINVLDVGCADGTVTSSLAYLLPQVNFLGIDLKDHFIQLAQEKVGRHKNLQFEKVYLRDLLARPQRFESVIFCSVLHEFFTYGEGISSVLKAVADAHELLHEGGNIVIRDMIMSDASKSQTKVDKLAAKIYAKVELKQQIADFETRYGMLANLCNLNHFLLKYRYTDNWERELAENYTAITFEQYEKMFELLGMQVTYKKSYLIDFMRTKWNEDFGFTDGELVNFISTGILVAEKEKRSAQVLQL
jgi:SAM-dependent methyltransferase